MLASTPYVSRGPGERGRGYLPQGVGVSSYPSGLVGAMSAGVLVSGVGGTSPRGSV